MRLSQIPSCSSTISGPSPATSEYNIGAKAWGSGRDELAALRAHAFEQFRERVGELLHAFLLEHDHDVVVVDAGPGYAFEDAPRLVQVAFERERHLAVV